MPYFFLGFKVFGGMSGKDEYVDFAVAFLLFVSMRERERERVGCVFMLFYIKNISLNILEYVFLQTFSMISARAP